MNVIRGKIRRMHVAMFIIILWRSPPQLAMPLVGTCRVEYAPIRHYPQPQALTTVSRAQMLTRPPFPRCTTAHVPELSLVLALRKHVDTQSDPDGERYTGKQQQCTEPDQNTQKNTALWTYQYKRARIRRRRCCNGRVTVSCLTINTSGQA